MSEIFAIGDRTNNAELIVDCNELGYIGEYVLDMTYGLGRFWTLHRPEHLTTNDIDPKLLTGFSEDFRDLPFADETFDTVVFDPPYKLNGTGGSHASDAAYGVADGYVSIKDRHALICDGITEGTRVLRRGKSHLLVKCQDQVSSGRVQWQTFMCVNHAEGLGLRLVDILHVRGYRKQPLGRRQVHARRDYSTLLVFGWERR